MDQITLGKISIYPNPSQEFLNFKGFTTPCKVSVFDISGKKVLNGFLESDQGLNISKLTSGIYVIKFEGSDETYKFIKE